MKGASVKGESGNPGLPGRMGDKGEPGGLGDKGVAGTQYLLYRSVYYIVILTVPCPCLIKTNQ